MENCQYFQVRGSHVGACLPSSGIWYHTQCYLKKGASSTNTIHHLDFDAPTREHAQQLPDDKVFFVLVLQISLKFASLLQSHLDVSCGHVSSFVYKIYALLKIIIYYKNGFLN